MVLNYPVFDNREEVHHFIQELFKFLKNYDDCREFV
jgi:hypothetical protein